MRAGESTSLPSDDDEGGVGLGDIVRLLRRRIVLIVLTTAFVTALAAGGLSLVPDRYEAAAAVQIDPRKRTILPIENVASDLRTDNAIVESEVEVVRSRPISLRVIEALGLRDDPEFNEPQGFKAQVMALLRRMSGIGGTDAGLRNAEPDGVTHHDTVLATFNLRNKVSRVRNSLVIEIRFASRDPFKAARIANAIAGAYIADQINWKAQVNDQARELLEHKLGTLRRQVFEAEHKVAAFKSTNRIVDAEGQLLSEKQLARVMEQTVFARNTAADARAKSDQVTRLLRAGGDEAGITDVLNSHTVRLLKEVLAKATRRKAELRTRYGPEHPEMLKALAEVADVEGKIETEVRQIVANLLTEARIAEDREQQLRASLDELKQEQVVMREASVRLREHEREAHSVRQVFEAVLARHKQTIESQALQLADSRMIEAADSPMDPMAPKRGQIMLAGLAGGLALSIGLVLALEFAMPGLKKPEDIEEALDTPHLASVPVLSANGRSGKPRPFGREIFADQHGLFAEAMRTARHEIDAGRTDSGPRVILLTSTMPNEGKTLIAANLAHLYAASGLRTVLVDADLRKAELTERLSLAGGVGLADVLVAGVPVESTLRMDSGPSLMADLAFIAARGERELDLSAPEALASPAFARALHDLRARFDIVIVDSPPLLPVVDARIIAEHVDQIVMNIVWRRTPTQLAKRAIKLLGANAGKIAGVVVNQVDPIELADTLGYGSGEYRKGTGQRRPRAA